MIRRVATFWTEDRSLSALLLLLVVQVFVMSPLPEGGHAFLKGINGIVCSFFLLAGLLTATRHLLARWLLAGLVAAAIAVRWLLVTTTPSQTLLVADSCFFLVITICFTAAVLRKVYTGGKVSAHRVRGAIAAYLLFGYTFSAAYRLLHYTLPGSLALNPALVEQGKNLGDVFMYFSIVTLTTVGFGDVTAVHPLARSLVMLEGIIGTLYPAILLARLVSLQIEHEKD